MVAPVTFQVRLEFPPSLMLVGLAVKELMTGGVAGGGEGGPAATVTVTVLLTLPAELVAVSV